MKIAIALLLLSCFLAASHAFRCKEAPRYYAGLNQLDAGHGFLVATSRFQTLMLSGRWWNRLGQTRLRQVSVGGAGVWGVDSSNKVYKMVGSDFVEARGMTLKWVAAGGDGYVMGLRASDNRTVCLRESRAKAYKGVGSLSWTLKSTNMKQISCGGSRCWAVNAQNQVYVMNSVNSFCGSTSWMSVSGRMKSIKVGQDGRVFGVTTDGRVCERTSITNSNPRGSSWRDFAMCIEVDKLAYDLGTLWVASKSGFLMECRG